MLLVDLRNIILWQLRVSCASLAPSSEARPFPLPRAFRLPPRTRGLCLLCARRAHTPGIQPIQLSIQGAFVRLLTVDTINGVAPLLTNYG